MTAAAQTSSSFSPLFRVVEAEGDIISEQHQQSSLTEAPASKQPQSSSSSSNNISSISRGSVCSSPSMSATADDSSNSSSSDAGRCQEQQQQEPLLRGGEHQALRRPSFFDSFLPPTDESTESVTQNSHAAPDRTSTRSSATKDSSSCNTHDVSTSKTSTSNTTTEATSNQKTKTSSTTRSSQLGLVTQTQQTSTDRELEAVGRFLRRGAVAGWSMWLVLMFCAFRFAPVESFERLQGSELRACWMMVVLLFVTNGSRLLPLAFQHNGLQFMKSGILMGAFSVQCIALLSCYIMAVFPTPIMTDPMTGMRIHLVRFCTWTPLCFLMTFLTEAIDIPFIEGETGIHKQPHDNNGGNKHQSQSHTCRVAWGHGIALAVSTACGGVFPFCHTWTSWSIVMTISWVLFFTLYVRLYQRYTRYQNLKRQQQLALLQAKQLQRRRSQNQSHRSLNAIKEAVDRARFSFYLIVLCSIAWTCIALSFCLCGALPYYFSPDSWLANPDIPLLSGYVFEGLSKIWYLSLQLQVYDRIFDEANRSVRRLEELRALMSALWEASSDILVICAKTEHTIHVVLSPNSLLQPPPPAMLNPDELNSSSSSSNRNNNNLSSPLYMSTMLEISPQQGTFCYFPVDLSKPVTRIDAWTIQQARMSSRKEFGTLKDFTAHHITGTPAEKNLITIAHLAHSICESHLEDEKASDDEEDDGDVDEDEQSSNQGQAESWMLQELYAPPKNGHREETRIKCEAKVTPIDAGALLLVLRDVSERYQRFEVEKQLLEEVIVRKKDAEAIRFTRHEVKNGLLAAIGIVDSFREAYEKQKAALESATAVANTGESQLPAETNNSQSSSNDDSNNLDSYMNDLDTTLRDVLEVILDNAMTREVIFEGYVPRRESVDLSLLFQNARKTRNAANNPQTVAFAREFILETTPKPFPDLLLDPQLVRNIYQNAISNACKYGQVDGQVKTILNYEPERQMFRLEVFNLPGYNHDELLKLSQEEIDCVFSEGTQLRANQCLETEEGKLASARSSGDGAWIMQKGAQCLGGKCGIQFTSAGTTFTLECPAMVCEEWQERQQADAGGNDSTKGAFALPQNVWAIAVEDSAMQRKLLERFLKKAGIAEDRFLALGKTNEEIYNFTDTVRAIMEEHPSDKFLLIIDENLDIVEGGAVTKTVSGSFSIHEFRESLDPATESRMLALIRSANDSVREVELYQTRGHGFLLKGPMKKGGLLEEIKPWWIRRFMPPPAKKQGAKSPKKHHRPSSSSFSDSCSIDELGPARERIIDLVREVDSMTNFSSHGDGDSSNEEDSFDSDMTQNRLRKRTTLIMDWQSIRYKLMLLNVDLKTYSNVDNFALAAKMIDDITNTQAGGFLPQDLQNRWSDIRDRIFREL